MKAGRTSTQAASVLSVLILGLAFIVPSEYTNPGYYAKHLILQSGLVVLAILAFRSRLPLPTPRLFLPVAILLLLHLASMTQSVNRVESVLTVVHRVAIVTTALMIAASFSRDTFARVIRVLAATSAVVAVIGIGQYLGSTDLLAIPSSGMPSATLGYRNFAAAFTIAVIPFVVVGLIGASSSGQLALWSVALTLNATFLVATRTRAAWIACVLSLAVVAVCVILKKRSSRQSIGFPNLLRATGVIAVSGAVAILFSTLIQPQMEGLGYDRNRQEKASLGTTISTTLEAGSDKDRLNMWKNTLSMIRGSSILGVGPGNWQYVYPKFDQGEVAWTGGTPRRPHNDYLWITSETGIAGGLLLAVILVLIASASRGSLRANRNRTAFLQALGATASIVAISVHAAFSFPLERIPVMLVASLAVAILIQRESSGKTARSRAVWAVTIGLHLAGSAVVWRALTFDKHAYRQSAAADSNAWDQVRHEGDLALRNGVVDPQVLMLRGLAHHVSGNHAAAIQDQERCLEYHPYFVNAINNLGMSLNASGRYREAVDVLVRIAPLNPNHMEQHLNLYQSYAGLGAETEAEDQLRTVLAQSRDVRSTALNLAGYHESRSEPKLATKVIREALNRRPTDFQLVYRLGVIEQKSGNFGTAVKHFLEVTRLSQAYAPAHYNLGEIFLTKQDTTSALISFNTFLNLWNGNAGPAEAVRKRIESLQ